VKLLIDGDTLCYRAAFSQEATTISGVCDKLDELMGHIFEATNPYATPEDYAVFLTGKGNFRHDLIDTYKANPIDKPKPLMLPLARQYLIDSYNASVSEGEEADDVIAIEATRLYPECVIVSVDKDFRQVPSTIYNPSRNSWEKIDHEAGLFNFYEQLLTGDTADNIIGIYKVGPVKAKKMLAPCATEQDMFDVCLEAYEGDLDRMVVNARLLWLRRYEGQMWEPPSGITTQ